MAQLQAWCEDHGVSWLYSSLEEDGPGQCPECNNEYLREHVKRLTEERLRTEARLGAKVRELERDLSDCRDLVKPFREEVNILREKVKRMREALEATVCGWCSCPCCCANAGIVREALGVKP